MSAADKNIPFYKEINDFLGSFSFEYKTKNPLFYCMRLRYDDPVIPYYKPPFKKGFYSMNLITDSGNTEVIYNDTSSTKLDSFFVFQSPGQIYSYARDKSASGYLIYFKRECFSFFRPDFDKEFPFFNILYTNLYKLGKTEFDGFKPQLEYLFEMYEKGERQNNYNVATASLLTLLYQFKEFASVFEEREKGITAPEKIIVKKFTQLINMYYLNVRTIEEYAYHLHVTPNYLSRAVKEASGKNALSFINERIMFEAKSLIQFTDFTIAEIAYRLNFSDPANFGKFFKKHLGLTPLEFRKK